MDSTRSLHGVQGVAYHSGSLQQHPHRVELDGPRSQLRIYDLRVISIKRDGLRERRVSQAHEPQRDRARWNPVKRIASGFISKRAYRGSHHFHRGTRESGAVILRADHARH